MRAGMKLGGFAQRAGSLLCLWCVAVVWSTVAWAGTGPVKADPKSSAHPNGQCTTCDPDNPGGGPPTKPRVDSQFVGQTVATTMIAGTTQTVTVQFKNTGTTSWTTAAGFRLGTLLDSTWGMDHVDLPTTVNHLQTATFTFSIRAPSTPGNYAFQWMMEHDGVGFLGQPGVGVHIEVLAPAKGTLSSSLNPCNIPAGSTTCTSIVSWTSNRPTTGIWITELDGSGLVNFSASGGSLTGSRTANWIWSGGTIFHLRESANGPDLASLQVRGNQPPNITLTAPVNGSVALAPATVLASANASDPDGSVQRVEFWGDGSLIKTVTAPPYQANWANLGAGSHKVEAIAYDNLGNSRWANASTFKLLSGSISASPNPCDIPVGATVCTELVTWTSSSATSEVWIANLDGSSPRLFASGQSGSKSAPWISADSHCFFLKSDGITIATVDVRGTPPPQVSSKATIVYDELGRVLERRDSGNQAKAKYTYDAEGNILTTTDGLGRTITRVYDAFNRVVQSTDPAGNVTRYGYDVADRVTKVIDPRNNATTYNVDGFGQVWTQVSPDTGTTSYTYNASGQLTGMTRNDGSSLSYVYDALGRPVSIGNSQESRTYSYDACTNGKGLLCRINGIKAGNTNTWSTFAYTPQGWLATRQDAMQGTVNTTGYNYDSLGRPTGISYPSGVAVGYAYDHGKLAAVTSTVGGATTNIATGFRYQPFGTATEWTYGNGLKHSASFDPSGRLIGLGASNASTVRQNLSYGYNLGDEITAITNGVDATQNRAYVYDAAGRLWKDTRSNLVWSFDANGNHNRFTSPGMQTDYLIEPASNRVSSYTTLAGVRTDYQYDARGNRKMAQDQPGITQAYTYDAFNRLVTVTTGTQTTFLLYNAQDQRVGKATASGATRYTYVGDQLVAEHGPTGWKSYIWAGTDLIGVVQDNGATSFVHDDRVGRPEVVTDASKEVVWRASNGPYGRTVAMDQIGGLNLGFLGQYQDVETGLWINGFRVYDESIGRYLESDPIGLAGGTNTYAYVNADPVSSVDPDGLTKVNLFSSKDGELFKRANEYKDDPNKCLVYAHGSPSFIYDTTGSETVRMDDPAKIAALLKAAGCTSNMEVVIYSCRAGQGDISVAADLAKTKIFSRVTAPTSYVWYNQAPSSNGPTWIYGKKKDGTMDTSDPGEWRSFP